MVLVVVMGGTSGGAKLRSWWETIVSCGLW